MISWEQQKDYYQSSREGYRISWGSGIYPAWDTQRGNNRQIIKGNCKTLDQAKAECELHQMRSEK